MDNLEARTNLFEAKTSGKFSFSEVNISKIESNDLLLNIFIGLEDQVNGIIDNEILSTTITMLLRDLSSMRHYMSLDNKTKDSDNV